MTDLIQHPNGRSPMSQQAVTVHGERSLTAADLRTQVNLIQDVMRSVMVEETHYGTIPGTKKKSLYKPGAEALCVTFRIADKYHVEDLSSDGICRYRVKCVGEHQTTGIILGEGMGECSSHEEKYKWRAAVCEEEFEETPDNMRRVKWGKYYGRVERKQQIRTEPADQANTILKMACKRAKVAMTLNVTAASDIFTQDIEDLPPELRAQHDETERNIPPADPIGDIRKQRHDEAVEQYRPSVEAIRAAIATDTQASNKPVKDADSTIAYKVAEVWSEIPSSAQLDLFLATKYGGLLTTFERNYIKYKLPFGSPNGTPSPDTTTADKPKGAL